MERDHWAVDEGARVFRERFRGDLLQGGDEGYDEARTVWNAMIDRKPALIARPAGAADVMTAVDFAHENDVLVSVKGSGHNVAGNAVCEDGLMIDLAEMDNVRVDTETRMSELDRGQHWVTWTTKRRRSVSPHRAVSSPLPASPD